MLIINGSMLQQRDIDSSNNSGSLPSWYCRSYSETSWCSRVLTGRIHPPGFSAGISTPATQRPCSLRALARQMILLVVANYHPSVCVLRGLWRFWVRWVEGRMPSFPGEGRKPSLPGKGGTQLESGGELDFFVRTPFSQCSSMTFPSARRTVQTPFRLPLT